MLKPWDEGILYVERLLESHLERLVGNQFANQMQLHTQPGEKKF